ncbi:MAG: YbjN domain-containing protein, partial [Planctomycetota bacterium]|nr:YbjN domain-containing protein [Planctomycetota bacterium]
SVVTDCSPTAVEPSEGRPAMNAAYEKLIQHLDERDVRYLTNGESRSICADFRCEVGTYRIIAAVDAESELFQVFGYSPVRVPEGARAAVAETIARANYGLKVGKFEMDFEEGELRFQAAQILTEDSLDENVIDRLLSTTMSMLDMYLPAVLSVIYGNELPKDAIRCVEAGRCNGGEGNERGVDV